MNFVYVDTSVATAIAFDESGAARHALTLNKFDRLFSSNLLEAELRAAFKRENLDFQESGIAGIKWILPERTLSQEFELVLDAGYLRGADLWHLATALYIASQLDSLAFATLDAQQCMVAKTLGFHVPLEAISV